MGVSTNAGPLIAQDFALTTEQLEWFLGSLNFWSIAGALVSPFVSDQYGRRTTLRTAALGFLIGVTICASAPNFATLMVGRMIVGVGVGVGEAIDPMYIAEIAPAHVRGELVSWAEAGVAVGVVLGFASSLLPLEGAAAWRPMLALGIILPLLMLILATFVLPESPRWLVAHHKEPAARAILERIYPTDNLVEHVVTDINESLALEQLANQRVGWRALLRPSPAIRRMLIVGIGIACIQQAVGIDSIMFYLMFVLKQSGVESELGQDWALIALGTVKLAFVFVGARNFDHSGRRPMLFLSLGGMTLSLLVVSFTFTNTSAAMKSLTVVALAFYLAFFSIGLGPGNWVVVSEIFAPSIRAKAMMLAVLPNRLTATFMASTFLSVAQALTWPGFFLLLAGICMASMLFLYMFLPETKGKTLEDMVRYFAEVTGDRSILDLEHDLKHDKVEHEGQEGQPPSDQGGIEMGGSEEVEYGTLDLRLKEEDDDTWNQTVPIT